ncbi:MAG: hypothetical protein Q8873_05775 [Bacillota bacterium]|nr:hypothetical protein [Bacillota bacterium]
MNDYERRRRAHYDTAAPSNKQSGAKIFIQLLLCMVIVAVVVFGGTHELPIGQTACGIARDSVSRNTDLKAWVDQLREVVAKHIGEPAFPNVPANKDFTEETVSGSAKSKVSGKDNKSAPAKTGADNAKTVSSSTEAKGDTID